MAYRAATWWRTASAAVTELVPVCGAERDLQIHLPGEHPLPTKTLTKQQVNF